LEFKRGKWVPTIFDWQEGLSWGRGDQGSVGFLGQITGFFFKIGGGERVHEKNNKFLKERPLTRKGQGFSSMFFEGK